MVDISETPAFALIVICCFLVGEFAPCRYGQKICTLPAESTIMRPRQLFNSEYPRFKHDCWQSHSFTQGNGLHAESVSLEELRPRNVVLMAQIPSDHPFHCTNHQDEHG